MTELVLSILVLYGKVNFMNLGRYSPYNERTFRRHFSDDRWDYGQLNGAFITETVPESHELIAVMDASFLPKSGKKTFGLDYFWNGCHQRSERGLELSLVGLIDVKTEQAYTLLAQQTARAPNAPAEEEFNRMDDYILHLDAARSHLPARVKYLAADGSYVKERFIQAVVNHGLHFISKLRSDADLRFVFTGDQLPRGRKRQYDGKVNLNDPSRFTQVTEVEPGIDLYTAIVWQISGKRNIRLAYLRDTRNPSKPTYVTLFSTDLDQDPIHIYNCYRLRFQIEFIFRDGKQFTGLQDCQARDAKKIDFHLKASLFTLNCAKFETAQNHPADSDFTFSMNNVKRKAYNQFLIDAFITNFDLEPTSIKSHPNYHILLNLGRISPSTA